MSVPSPSPHRGRCRCHCHCQGLYVSEAGSCSCSAGLSAYSYLAVISKAQPRACMVPSGSSCCSKFRDSPWHLLSAAVNGLPAALPNQGCHRHPRSRHRPTPSHCSPCRIRPRHLGRRRPEWPLPPPLPLPPPCRGHIRLVPSRAVVFHSVPCLCHAMPCRWDGIRSLQRHSIPSTAISLIHTRRQNPVTSRAHVAASHQKGLAVIAGHGSQVDHVGEEAREK